MDKFPNGGWARINSIKNGKWKPWHPRPVLIPADRFMEKDQTEQYQWIHDRWPKLIRLTDH